LTTQLIKERSQDTDKQNRSRIAELEGSLSRVDVELGDWLRELRRRNPGYARLKYPAPVTLAETQRLLDDKTVLLSIRWVNQHRFCSLSAAMAFRFIACPRKKWIAESVHKLLAAITDKNRSGPGRNIVI